MCGVYQLASGTGRLEPEDSKGRESQSNSPQTIVQHRRPLSGLRRSFVRSRLGKDLDLAKLSSMT